VCIPHTVRRAGAAIRPVTNGLTLPYSSGQVEGTRQQDQNAEGNIRTRRLRPTTANASYSSHNHQLHAKCAITRSRVAPHM
jgi:hypothetical protein